MLFKKIILSGFAILLPFLYSGRSAVYREKTAIRDNINKVYRAITPMDDSKDIDPNEVLSSSIAKYEEEFSDYLDITGLNVEDKEEIELPEFDKEYVAPKFYTVMHDYQDQLYGSLDVFSQRRYENLRMFNYSFDRYVALNNNYYENLNPSLKYQHEAIPVNPLYPMTPRHPDIDTGSSSTRAVAAAATAGIVAILSGAGLEETAIAGFTAAVSTLTTGLSTSFIPIIGWAIAVGIVVGALIALAVIIVENWDAICDAMDEIKDWFLEQFSVFASLITTYFSDAAAKGEKSTVTGRDKIGGKEIEWKQSKRLTDAIAISIADKRNKTAVYLRKNVKKKPNPENGLNYTSFWIASDIVDEQYVEDSEIYDKGISTYTWYNDTARRRRQKGSETRKYNSIAHKIIYHKFTEAESHNRNGWNHYHIYKLDGKEYVKCNTLLGKAHSFFGPRFLRKSGYGDEVERYPDRSKN